MRASASTNREPGQEGLEKLGGDDPVAAVNAIDEYEAELRAKAFGYARRWKIVVIVTLGTALAAAAGYGRFVPLLGCLPACGSVTGVAGTPDIPDPAIRGCRYSSVL